jgi:hypothetical protein
MNMDMAMDTANKKEMTTEFTNLSDR